MRRLIALLVALFFLFAGRSLLSYLGVTIHAFAISGGCCSSPQRCRCCLVIALVFRRPSRRSIRWRPKTRRSFR